MGHLLVSCHFIAHCINKFNVDLVFHLQELVGPCWIQTVCVHEFAEQFPHLLLELVYLGRNCPFFFFNGTQHTRVDTLWTNMLGKFNLRFTYWQFKVLNGGLVVLLWRGVLVLGLAFIGKQLLLLSLRCRERLLFDVAFWLVTTNVLISRVSACLFSLNRSLRFL